MNSRDITIICITIILLIAIGAYVMIGMNVHHDTSIMTMTSSSSLTEGDSLVLKLTDDKGNPLPNQKIEINMTHASNGITENFTLKTNTEGVCKLEDLPADNYTLSAKYNGNNEYEPAYLGGMIYVKKSDKASTQTSSSDKYKTANTVDDVVNGWDPSEHEVSREDLGDGTYRITYDDGYFRIVDKDGNILTYGY